ncbi:hypothetical protein ABD67_10055 [Bacillus sonorensis]|uniref:hypothetical protein n=1 Tax=Bacillus sonorensis TaxID=119858 RepID=UPI0018CE0599|nr:hypothetical protein [Bacillus sonorensis]MBG9915248.1 hypothetical protein [Bacillus sonorensis]
MAKLHGVKTLDMVNGEITKVAYGGAEYERVEGTPSIFGRDGDLLLNAYDHSDLEVNAFYKIVNKSGYGMTIYDEVEDSHGSALIAGSVFRKVSASQPTLEDRVSTAEKDIAALKSDVATLKSEAKPEYVRIAKSEAKAGDFVKFDEAPNEYLTAGKFYGIYRVDGCGDPHIQDDEGDDFDTYGCDFEVYRKVSAAEPKPERLKVGDYAKVVGTARNGCCDRGDIVKITEDDDSAVPFKLAFVNGEYAGWEDEKSLVRATDEEVAEAKRKQAEVKECKRWAAIGREVGEYRIGDIVGYDDRTAFETNGFGEVVSESGGGTLRIEAVDNFGDVERYNVDPDELNLIVPVEARFDRK